MISWGWVIFYLIYFSSLLDGTVALLKTLPGKSEVEREKTELKRGEHVMSDSAPSKEQTEEEEEEEEEEDKRWILANMGGYDTEAVVRSSAL